MSHRQWGCDSPGMHILTGNANPHRAYTKYQLCSKYDREVVLCRKLRWICRKHSNHVVQQVGTPGKATIFVARHNFHVALEVMLYHAWNTSKQMLLRCIFSLISCEVLRPAAIDWYIIKFLFHEYLCSIIF